MDLACKHIGVKLTWHVSCVLEVWGWSWLNWFYMCGVDAFMLILCLDIGLWMWMYENDLDDNVNLMKLDFGHPCELMFEWFILN